MEFSRNAKNISLVSVRGAKTHTVLYKTSRNSVSLSLGERDGIPRRKFFDGNWKPYRSKKIDHKMIGNRLIIDANHCLANLHQ
jgi:hypothetical protein